MSDLKRTMAVNSFRETFHEQPHQIIIVASYVDDKRYQFERVLKATVTLAITAGKHFTRIPTLSLIKLVNGRMTNILQPTSLPGNFNTISKAIEDLTDDRTSLFNSGGVRDVMWDEVFTKISSQMIDLEGRFCITIFTDDEKMRIELSAKENFSKTALGSILLLRCQDQDALISDSDLVREEYLVNDLHLDQVFRKFLLDQSPASTAYPQLQLWMPSNVFATRPLVLFCDTSYRHLNPSIFPPGLELSIDPGPTTLTSGKRSPKVPIYNLEAVSIIKNDGICQSLLMGSQNIILTATLSWKMNWAEQSENHTRFAYLCKTLTERSLSLLVKLKKAETAAGQVCGKYLLSPTPDNALLLKPICTRELLLPLPAHPLPVDWDEIDEGVKLDIDTSLDHLKVLGEYSPFDHDVGVFPVLEAIQRKSRVSMASNSVGGSARGGRGVGRGVKLPVVDRVSGYR